MIDEIYGTRRLLAKAYFDPEFNSIIIQYIGDFLYKNFPSFNSFYYSDKDKYFEISIPNEQDVIAVINSLYDCFGNFLNHCIEDVKLQQYLQSINQSDYILFCRFIDFIKSTNCNDKQNGINNVVSVLSLANGIYRINLI